MDWDSFLKTQGKPEVNLCASCDDPPAPQPERPPRDTLPKGSFMFIAVGKDGLRRNMIITEDGRTCPLDDYLDGAFDSCEGEGSIYD